MLENLSELAEETISDSDSCNDDIDDELGWRLGLSKNILELSNEFISPVGKGNIINNLYYLYMELEEPLNEFLILDEIDNLKEEIFLSLLTELQKGTPLITMGI